MSKIPLKFLIVAGFATVATNSLGYSPYDYDPKTDPDYCVIDY